MSRTLTIREIYDAARSAGFTPHQAVTWTAIAMAESGGRTGALNDKGEYSVGLWQINVRADSSRADRWGDLSTPEGNARAAYAISLQGRDMRPWTTTHDRNKGTGADYRSHLGKVEKEIGVAGDPRGVHGYGSKPLAPLAVSQYDQIDAGRPLAEPTMITSASGTPPAPGTVTPTDPGQQDSDRDGLTDQFERLAGTDPTQQDSDADGLTDAYEAGVSRTDPLLADTDGDSVGDAAEIAQGADAGTVPGRAYVVGEGLFAENVRGGAKDADDDGLSDHTEKLVGTDPDQADTDGDQLSDSAEASLGTDPTVADTDADGVTDGLEVQSGTDPLGPRGGPFDQSPTPAWTLEGAANARAAADAQQAAQRQVADQVAAQRAGEQQADEQQAASTSSVGGVTGASPGSAEDKLSIFLSSAKDQVGDRYVYGAPRTPTAADPKTFDCSSFTQWAARQAGVKLDGTAETQYMQLKRTNHDIPVEQALKTKGALLFYFSREPSGALPAGQAHVAISLGDGRTVEAKGTRYGVGEWSAKHRFNYAATVPGISDEEGLRAHHQGIAASSTADDPDAPTSVGNDPGTGAGIYGSTGTVDGAGWGGSNGSSGSNGRAAASTAATYQIDAGQPVDALPGAEQNDPDTDSDGLTDAFEKLAGTDPTKADTDSDGLSDGQEAVVSKTDPLAADTDGDGASDAQEMASGTDAGRLPGVAGVIGTGRYAENVRDGITDRDGDGLTDRTEELAGTNPELADTDGDQLADAAEASHGSDPTVADTDADGVFDGVEIQFGSDPLDAASTIGSAAGAGPGGADLGAGLGQPAGATMPTGAAGDDPLGSSSSIEAEPLDLG